MLSRVRSRFTYTNLVASAKDFVVLCRPDQEPDGQQQDANGRTSASHARGGCEALGTRRFLRLNRSRA